MAGTIPDIAILQRMIPLTNRNRPKSLQSAGPLWITVHETGNTRPGASEYGEATFSIDYEGGASNVAYHFAVGPSVAIQLLPLNVIGWHAGDGCDSRAQDIGCFSSIAIEVTVGDNNRDAAKTRANLLQLIVAIVAGDSRIDFGGTDHKRFSTQRIAPHKRWSSYSKDCPHFMLKDGSFWTITDRTTKLLAGVIDVPSIPAGGFPAAVPIPELLPYRSGDPNTIPYKIALPDGTTCVWVGDRVRALRDTPRKRYSTGDQVIGPMIKGPAGQVPGEEFPVDWLLLHPERADIYYSPWGTRILAADTARVLDLKEVIAA